MEEFKKLYLNHDIVKELQKLEEISAEEFKNIPDLAILQLKKLSEELAINGEVIIKE